MRLRRGQIRSHLGAVRLGVGHLGVGRPGVGPRGGEGGIQTGPTFGVTEELLVVKEHSSKACNHIWEVPGCGCCTVPHGIVRIVGLTRDHFRDQPRQPGDTAPSL